MKMLTAIGNRYVIKLDKAVSICIAEKNSMQMKTHALLVIYPA